MKSLRTKLWIGMMILVATNIFLLWFFQIIFLDQFYSALEIGRTTKKAESIVQTIESLEDIEQLENSEDIQMQLENYIFDTQASVEILDTNFQTVFQGSTGNNLNVPGTMREDILSVTKGSMNGEIVKKITAHPKFGYEFMVIGVPIVINENIEGSMVTLMPIASIEKTISILKTQLLIITAILLIISVLLSFFLSKNLTAPIQKISKQAKSYELGDYNVRISDIRNDEIGELATRMNSMGEALTRNDIIQKELIANVSHELRTPLTLIQGYAETLRDVSGENPDKRNRQLTIIIEESARLGKMVEDILLLSRLQSGTDILEKETFSLKETLLSVQERYETGTDTRLNIIGLEQLKSNPIGDKNKINQVFYNIINNALQHGGNVKKIDILVTQLHNKIRVEIKDYGKGILEKDLPHIFERYYKIRNENGEKNHGSGLGLAIVRSIFELHNASYGVESTPDQGTTFWFELDSSVSHNSF